MKKIICVLFLIFSLTLTSAQIQIEKITFMSHGQIIKGNLYIPVTSEYKLPAIIVTGAWTTVKEHMPAIYAKKIAQKGFIALTFDFRGWGESEGKCRYLESPKRKIQDIIAASNYLASHPKIDAQKIGGLGICASAGYMAQAAVKSSHIYSVAMVAPWLHDKDILLSVYGRKNIELLKKVASQAQKKYETTGNLSLIPAASKADKNALMYNVPYYTEEKRGLIPQWNNKFNLASWKEWLDFDAIAIAKNFYKPLFIVHSTSAAIPHGAKKFYKNVKGYKKQLWLRKISQFDFYDKPSVVSRSIKAIFQYFTKQFYLTDTKKVKNIIRSVATLADSNNYEILENLFADQVNVDYTSAFGGKPQIIRSKNLMIGWASLLPGFEQTLHTISNIRVSIQKNRAYATANVTADHYIQGLHWQVQGSYKYSFVKKVSWKITSMTFLLAKEIGSRNVLGIAAKRAKKYPCSYILREKMKKTVRDFLLSLEKKDMKMFASVWHKDAVHDMPFSPRNFPKKVMGKKNIVKHFSAWPQISGKAVFTKDLRFYPMQNPEMIFAQWSGIVEVIPTKRIYRQSYGGLFHVKNGKIMLFREYYDPIVFQYAFGLK